MKNIFNKTLLLLAAAFTMGSCSENEIDDVNLTVDGNDASYEFSAQGGEHSFIVRSNLAEWELIYMNEDSEWLKVWPKEGDFDGRFTVTAPAYDGAYTREAVLILASRGEEQQRFNIYQSGVSPFLKLASSPDVRISCVGSQDLRIAVSTNIGWKCIIPEGIDWLHLGEGTTAESQQLIVDENEGGERSCKIDFTMVGTGNESVTTSATITQLDAASNPADAVATSFKAIAAKLNYATGVVADNVKVECEVTSDYSGGNFDRSQLFVQDAEGQGILFAINDTSINTFNLGDKLTIHMLGKGLVVDTKGIFFTDLSTDSILENENDTPLDVQPVEIASLSDLTPAMAGTLVSLTAVEYAVPYGSYCNFDEGYYGKTIKGYTPLLLQDADGNTIVSRVEFGQAIEEGAIFKYSRYLPKGSGQFVGLLQYNPIDGIYIKMRTLEDDQITEENRMWKHAVEFYWPDRSILNFSKETPVELSAATGNGTLFLDGISTLLYNAGFAYVRTNLEVRADSDPTGADGVISSYQALNTSGTGWSTVYNGSNATGAAAWVITVDASEASKVALSLSTSSSAAGPGEFTVLYSIDGGTTFKETNYNYNVIPWNVKNGGYNATTYGHQTVLPADAAGCSNLVVRLTPRSTTPADAAGYSTISTGGTNRISYLTVMTK